MCSFNDCGSFIDNPPHDAGESWNVEAEQSALSVLAALEAEVAFEARIEVQQELPDVPTQKLQAPDMQVDSTKADQQPINNHRPIALESS
jgi:hypothetical protein